MSLFILLYKVGERYNLLMTIVPIIKQVMRQYHWHKEYAYQVAREYGRFMKLRNESDQCSPSDDIDKFWHQHILNTALYTEYCQKRFKRLVNHNPEDAYDQSKRRQRIKNSLTAYKRIFQKQPNLKVWNINSPNTSLNVKSSDNPKDESKAKLVVCIIQVKWFPPTKNGSLRICHSTPTTKLTINFGPNQTVGYLKDILYKKYNLSSANMSPILTDKVLINRGYIHGKDIDHNNLLSTYTKSENNIILYFLYDPAGYC